MKANKEPLIHISRRLDLTTSKTVLIKAIAICSGFIFALLLLWAFSGIDPISSITSIIMGNFSTPRRFWISIRETCLLLLVGLSLLPAFKMKYWNLGANGQILISAMLCSVCMFYMGKAGCPDWLIIIIMIPLGILGSIIWAIIPAIFKAFFNTNESLFTLMMNYIAAGLVAIFILGTGSTTGSIPEIKTGNLPTLGSFHYNSLLTILVCVNVFVGIYFYLKYSKHGYELTVVGESRNTAKYIGINTKSVIIRTLFVSGVLSGIVGVILAGSINHSVTSLSHANMGFTAIMAAWLAQFNPFVMIGTSYMITFINRGVAQVATDFSITNTSICSIVIGIIYFFIIAAEFFIGYKVHFRKSEQVVEEIPETIDATIDTEVTENKEEN